MDKLNNPPNALMAISEETPEFLRYVHFKCKLPQSSLFDRLLCSSQGGNLVCSPPYPNVPPHMSKRWQKMVFSMFKNMPATLLKRYLSLFGFLFGVIGFMLMHAR